MSSIAKYNCLAKDGSETSILALNSFSCLQIAKLASKKAGKPICLVLTEEPVEASALSEKDKKALLADLEAMGLRVEGGANIIPNETDVDGEIRLITTPSIYDDKPRGPSVTEIVSRLKGKPAEIRIPSIPVLSESEVSDPDLAEMVTEAEIRDEEEFEAQDKLVTEESRAALADALRNAAAERMVDVSARELVKRDLVFEVSEAPDKGEAADPENGNSLTGTKATLALLAGKDKLAELGKGRTSSELRKDEAIIYAIKKLKEKVPEMSFSMIEDYLGLRRAHGMTAHRLFKMA